MIATIIILLLMTAELTIHLAKHGEFRDEFDARYNFWIALINFAIQLVLYYFAGLFNCFSK